MDRLKSICYYISFWGYIFAALLVIVVGIRYSFVDKMMPYQIKALGRSWESVDPTMQILTLNFIKSYAAGWVTTGVSMLFLLVFPFRARELWSYFAVFTVAGIEISVILFRTIQVDLKTAGDPPVYGIIVLLISVCLFFVLSILSRYSSNMSSKQ